jgi:DNA replication licensing factor MCM6
VREAYTLLRQSIIHVEQDDIDFDEEELAGERPTDARTQAVDAEDSQDVEMSATEMEAIHQTEQSYYQSTSINGRTSSSTGNVASGVTSPGPNGQASPPPAVQAIPKRRMVITHDKYMSLQSLIVLHLSAVERDTGKGIDRDELIDWYLELKESEIQDVEELEYEKELITKVLKKLVKVS